MSQSAVTQGSIWDLDSLPVTFFPGELARLLLSQPINKRPSHEVARTGVYVSTEQTNPAQPRPNGD
ncbi:hypothetical protein CUC53_18640, partial [Aeromonas cavernicola]